MQPNTLLVHVSCARGLYLKNHNAMEAFASITLQGKGSTRSRVITEQIHTTGDCRWDENCEFKVNEKSTHILVVVSHKTRIGSSDLIGKCEVALEDARRVGAHTWFPLKKKKGDDKYRGEIQLQFTLSYEKPSLSISSTDLTSIEKDGMLDRMKRKMNKLGGKHKQAEDTMSIASGMSAMSMKSSRSNRFMSKLKTIGGGMHKSSTLPPGSIAAAGAFPEEDAGYNPSDSYDSPQYLTPHAHDSSRPLSLNSGFSRNGSSQSLSINAAPHHTIGMGLAAAVSPTISTAESFHRANSTRSAGSSGFGSASAKHANQKGGREAEGLMSQQDLLAQMDSLRLELQVKDSRMRDMQDYMDNLITRVMERCPDVLAAPQKPKRRFF